VERPEGTIMATSISSLSASFSIAQTTTAEPQAKVSSSSQQAVDTVEISDSAQAIALNQQGQSVSQIAVSLGITTQEVDSYLGITPASGSTTSSITTRAISVLL
jgi:predicted transcriptional regulator